jgi:hypothetical protein
MLLLEMLLAIFAVLVITFIIQYMSYNNSRHISVIYENNTSGTIKRNRLEELIVSGSITKFFRSSGWVTISDDPIRQTNNGYLIERRISQLAEY